MVVMPDLAPLKVGLVNLNKDLGSTVLSILETEPGFSAIDIDLESLVIPIPDEIQQSQVMVLGEAESNAETSRIMRFVKKMLGSPTILLILFHQKPFPLSELFQNGGNGCLCREALTEDLCLAITAVSQGRLFIEVCQSEHTWDFEKMVMEHDAGPGQLDNLSMLNTMERSVLVLVAKGHTHQQIADQLGLGKKSVEKYRSRIKEKLGLEKRSDLVQYALAHRLFDHGA